MDDNKQIVKWTNFHKYVNSFKNHRSVSITSDTLARTNTICKFLNYVFFQKQYISRLSEIEIYMVKDYLDKYGMCTLPDDNFGSNQLYTEQTHRSKKTIDRTISYIMDFLEDLIKNKKLKKIKKEDLYEEVNVFNTRRKKMIKYKKPVFKVCCNPVYKEPILRDLPDKVFFILLNTVIDKYPCILMVFALCAFAGLRPSEALNVRRPDSLLGPGIAFDYINGKVSNVYIDLTKELRLRSDNVYVGKIKKERKQRVYPAFLEVFIDCYNIYIDYVKNQYYEVLYGALSVNKQGKAMTYATYYSLFQKAVNDSIPIMLKSDDSQVRNYGLMLEERKIGPHILRHWFSVMLVLSGEDVASLMYWRGDRSPESSLTYLKNKGALEKRYQEINNTVFNYLLWRSNKIHEC